VRDTGDRPVAWRYARDTHQKPPPTTCANDFRVERMQRDHERRLSLNSNQPGPMEAGVSFMNKRYGTSNDRGILVCEMFNEQKLGGRK